MKSLLTLLAVAGMAASMHAVTVTWSLADPGEKLDATTEGYDLSYGLPTATTDWSFRAVLTLNGYTGGAFLGIGNKASIPVGYGGTGSWGNAAVSLALQSNPRLVIWEGPGTSAKTTSKSNPPISPNQEFAMALSFKANANGNGGTLSIYLNGAFYADVAFSSDYLSAAMDMLYFYNTSSVAEAEFGNGAFASRDEGMAAATVGGSLPEPTVLALLALGVAGLALRRSV